MTEPRLRIRVYTDYQERAVYLDDVRLIEILDDTFITANGQFFFEIRPANPVDVLEDEGDGREPDGQRLEGHRIVPTDR